MSSEISCKRKQRYQISICSYQLLLVNVTILDWNLTKAFVNRNSWIHIAVLCSSLTLYAPVKLFFPHPPQAPPGTLLIFGCLGLFITLFLPCPVLINHFNPFIFQCPAISSLHFRLPCPFYHKHFSTDLGAAWGDGAEQFDRRIIPSLFHPKMNWFQVNNHVGNISWAPRLDIWLNFHNCEM